MGKGIIARVKTRVEFFVLGFVIIVFLSYLTASSFYCPRIDKEDARYLLSAFLQAEAALLGLVIPLTFVAVQLSAQLYTPYLSRVHYRSPVFWIYIGVSAGAIVYTGAVLAYGGADNPRLVSSVFAGGALCVGLLVPFVIRTFRFLTAKDIFAYFAVRVTAEDFAEPYNVAEPKPQGEGPCLVALFEMIERCTATGTPKTAILGLEVLAAAILPRLRTGWANKTTGGAIANNLYKNLWSVGRKALNNDEAEVLAKVVWLCREIVSNYLGGFGGHYALPFYDTMVKLRLDAGTMFGTRAVIFREAFTFVDGVIKETGAAIAKRFRRVEKWDGSIIDRKEQLKAAIETLKTELFGDEDDGDG
jgi:hypothetical protein